MKIITQLFPKRFYLLKNFSFLFLVASTFVRLSLYVWSFSEISFSIINFLKVIGIGLFYDFGTLAFINAIYGIYWFLIPKKLYGTWIDKGFVYFTYFLLLFVFVFSFLGEFTFWNEFARRYNFIAVDYLLYTYEVIENINQSYPIPIILVAIIVLIVAVFYNAKKTKVFSHCFNSTDGYLQKLIPYSFWIFIACGFYFFIQNNQAEQFNNRYENELAKAGVYSFFAAYNNNELDYNDFYPTQDIQTSLQIVQKNLTQQKDSILENNNITRTIKNTGIEYKPNIIFICLESMNANFMEAFGNQKKLTPFLDSLANKSIFYTNLQATGTRTIRGMEAITLSIPPTPGRSIVKRPNNNNLFTIGEILKQKKYSRTFFYGGDGTFDNMNGYFSSNGFDIVDRPKKQRTSEELSVNRIPITDEEVTFENAWGACDGDIYNKVIQQIDLQSKTGKPFFNFVMSNTNHRPYTFPTGHIKEQPGNRTGALRYSDWALQRFFKDAKAKPWFKNTVFVIMSDHCAYSAGRTDLDVKSYHIPALIYNLTNIDAQKIDKLCSQIDVLPTLFGYLNWSYTSKIFGKDITKMQSKDERAFIANHRKLGLRKGNQLVILDETKNSNTYVWNSDKESLTLQKTDTALVAETIAFYQTSYELFKNNQLKATQE
ncbi:LTA synthase family protein [Wenyingzhuangia aestuarii]|uniref:LTA synthase family protein n=1 Tax=Wenyingzhuangia aestuarii TaxID=1647582 RepID=UPI0014396025|nr:alkaline phosphatase family protein [Wenyingzhuangia aestuarii]NJB83572.1 phosphoglycerol transferase MdoB-like AlkP superfamily enzyme [Wenyingzhuangia aestuarii]